MKSLSRKAFVSLPVGLQNAAFTVWGYHQKRQRYGRAFHRSLEWLKQTEWWSEDEIRDYQNERIRHIVQHSYSTVPAYRKTMDELGLLPRHINGVSDLQHLPVLEKPVVKSAPQLFRSSAYSRRDLKIGLTSGTTGSPLTVYLTPVARQFQWAVWWRHRARFGLKLGDPFLMFGARLPLLSSDFRGPVWRTNKSINQTYLSTYHLTPRTMPEVVSWLNTQNVKFYTGYPSAMYVLAHFIQENKLTLNYPPEHIVSGSDALIPAFEKTLTDVFRAPVTDNYGSAEACGNFARCEYGRYHLDAEFGVVEMLPVEGSDNPRLRRLIFTGLVNEAMPFIRYDQGDIGVVSEEPCLCGRQTVTLDRIEGRTEDYIRTPDGRMAIGMNQVFEWAPNLVEAQVRQDSVSRIEVLIVPTSEYSDSDERILEREFRARLGNEIEIQYRLVDSIPRSRSGKFRAVVSTITGESEAEKELQAAVAGDQD